MSKDPFCYTFRFCCDPGFNDKTETEALMRFVEEADIDDVAVFANVEEINTGHMDEAEQQVYIDLMRDLQARLTPKGITLSVNQWHSIMHADLGKRLRGNQHFRLMVDGNGKQADLCVCPMDNEWKRYIAGVYARYAVLHPEILWVEDDFRYHNHDPLTWGGCFCDEHMKLYSRKAGKTFSREEFIKGVLQPGKVHLYRKIWLDTCNEELCKTAVVIREAVHAIAPESKVGLMSSVPHVHAAEGRSWHKLLAAFAGGNKPVNRVHLPGYTEGAAWNYLQNFNMVSMACRALLPKETLVYPELENYPYSRFTKSNRFTRFQLLSALPLNLAGITIDLFDLNGNGIVWEEGYQDTLRKTKPYLNGLTVRRVFDAPPKGVCVMINEKASYFLHTKKGESMEELYPHEVFFAGLLPAMGVPYRYCTDPAVSGEVVAISGQYLRGMTAEQIKALFDHNFVILNGDAIDTLFGLGLGVLAGMKNIRWHKQNGGDYAFEQVTNGREYCGIAVARASAVISASDAVEIEYEKDAQVQEYTAFYDSFRRQAFAAETVVNNQVMIYPFGHFAQPLEVPQMLLNSVRQAILQEILQYRVQAPMVEKSPYLEPFCTEKDGKTCLYLVNGSSDDAEKVRLFIGSFAPKRVVVTPSNGKECAYPCEIKDGRLLLPVPVPSLESVLLTFE